MRVVYVAKLPPSRSGVARYADHFVLVLRRLGQVFVVQTGNEAEETSHTLRIVQVVASVRHALRRDPDLIVFEISGSALAELFAAAWCILFRRRRTFAIWITVHDAPALTGGLFWTGLLRRRGLRRVAAFLSEHLGSRIERWVLAEADIVVCLSSVGARALEHAYALDRKVQTIHFVADVASEATSRRQIFLPGPIQYEAANEVLCAIAATDSDFDILMGFCECGTQTALEAQAASLGVSARLAFAGFLDQTDLVEAYRSSLVVIHWYARSDRRRGYANSAACSGPAVDAIAAGSALVTNAARGAGEYLAESEAAYDLAESHESLGQVLTVLLCSPGTAEELGARALHYANRTLSVSAVAEEVRSRLEAAVPGLLARPVSTFA